MTLALSLSILKWWCLLSIPAALIGGAIIRFGNPIDASEPEA